MYELILENQNGDAINFVQNSAFSIVEIQGLNPPSATINTSQLALMDGGKFNSSKLNMRTLNIAFAIEYEAAKNRLEVFRVLKTKQWIKMIYNGAYRHVWIEGYIENIDIGYYEMKQIVTCNIICPSPYFKGAQTIVNTLQNIINSFHFPFASTEEPELVMGYFNEDVGITVDNVGDAECGIIIEIYAMGTVTNPKIYNYITGEFIGLNFVMRAGELITINTTQGNKTVTLLSNGYEFNLFNNVLENSTWLQLPLYGGTFVAEVSSGNVANLKISFKYDALYEGV